MESFLNGAISLHCGDCLEVMPTFAENSFDSACCDPPYHLQSTVKRFAKTGPTDKIRTTRGPHQRTANGFMNRVWDGGDIAFRPETWEHIYRVLKPGAYIVAFSSTRTFGRMSVAIEDAGFITHPFIAWTFGQGFPKAHRITATGLSELDRETGGWEGWRYGTQSLKPAIEPVYVGQKPFEDGLNGWQNIQKWGCGALNIDGCRVFGDDDEPIARDDEQSQDRRYVDEGSTDFAAKPGRRYTVKRLKPGATLNKTGGNWRPEDGGIEYHGELKPGRWPANVITDGSDEVLAAFPDAPGQQREVNESYAPKSGTPVYGDYGPRPLVLPRDDGGSAARFFAAFPMTDEDLQWQDHAKRLHYTAKADGDDRLGSKHPTVKPIGLMKYLVRLVTPPRGLVLDCFAGTGPTGEACIREGMRAVLIEREAEYQEDIRRRMRLVMSGPDERSRESIKAKTRDKPIDAGPLFGGTD